MLKQGMLMLWVVVLGLVVQAQESPPVVRIPGRADSQRPGWTASTSPQAIEVQNQPQSPERPEPPPPGVPVAGGSSVPIGTIVAWAGAGTMTNTPRLPDGWVACNGQVVDDPQSPYVGQALPDINGSHDGIGRFLRGAKESGGTGGSVTHVHDGYRSQKYGTQRSPVAAPMPANHLPPYYDVIWIMRIK